MVAEFGADLIRMRNREDVAVAKAKGRLRGKQPKLSKSQEAHLVTRTARVATPPPKSPADASCRA
ncbi:hypothetical protein GCM10023169_10370 [Georgenia halophila]|uniref:Resolvase/invertase-type recombinase catalytic domain-containing protein n=1 Tax=Georgenia halophila TaxID=620889 RepID=A0ABP8KZT2_9MICO